MSTLEQDTTPVSGGTVPAAAGRSIIDRVRERHEQREDYLELPIPAWVVRRGEPSDVHVRFHRIARKTMRNLLRRKQQNDVVFAADLLVAACDEVFVRDDNGNLQPASVGDGLDEPVRFDGRLADMFALSPSETQRDIVLRIFGDNEAAVLYAADRIFNWQTGAELDNATSEEVDDLAGEA